MTYLDNAPTTDLKTYPPAPSRASGTETDAHTGLAALRDMLPFMISLLRAHLGQRGAATMALRAKSVLRELYETEKHSVTLWVKQALRSCPEWRARVFEDLGGEAALKVWQARLARIWAPEPEENYDWLDDDPADWPIPDPAPPARKRTDRAPSSPRTDRDGLFRWAVIKTGRLQPREREYVFHEDIPFRSFFEDKARRKTFPDPWPIEVLPCDLLDPPEEEDIITLTIDPQKLWNILQTQRLKWHGQLVSIGHIIWPEKAAAFIAPP